MKKLFRTSPRKAPLTALATNLSVALVNLRETLRPSDESETMRLRGLAPRASDIF